MRRVTVWDRLRYRFDNTMSRGPAALIGWLAALCASFVLILSIIVCITGISGGPDRPGLSFVRIVWMSLLRTLDAGTMGGDTGTPAFLLAMLAVTLGGVFLVSILIGVLTNAIQGRVEHLRKGRSFVIERDHTLILGWSPQVFTIVSELAVANENQRRRCVVVLSEKDKVEMEDEIRSRVGPTGRTRVVCRTGSPIDLADLEIVNPHEARSIIILTPDGADPDAHVIKTLLALTNSANRRPEPHHIVAGIRDPRSLQLGRIVARDEARLLPLNEIIARITVQTCRQSGLSVVYTELLNFAGDEIYFAGEPTLLGSTFGEALSAYEDSTVIGLQRANGETLVNPPMDTVIAEGDRMIAISEDDDTVRISCHRDIPVDETAIRDRSPRPPAPERTLILGWNHRGARIIRELDCYVAPGSEIRVVANSPQAFEQYSAVTSALKNQRAGFTDGDTTDREMLEQLDVAGYDHIIVLNYSDELDSRDADSITLMTLLQLRDLLEKEPREISIVSEMLDLRNRELADVTRADDFIVSDQLISLLYAQISENKYLAAVFDDLFDPEGSEIYLKLAQDYVATGQPVNFYTVVESARRRGEVAIGYRLKRNAHDARLSYGVVLNPKKSETVTFSPDDRIIVVAEE